MKTEITEEIRNTPVSGEYDVIIAGGGPAGSCAAIAAARMNAKTLLLESGGCLGGIWTTGNVAWIIDASTKPQSLLISQIINELKQQNLLHRNPSASFAFDIEAMKFLLEKRCTDEDVRLRYHTNVVAVKKCGNAITHVITESKSGREAWRGKIFIDATGDGDLGALSGSKFQIGHPDSGKQQPMSLLGIVTGIDLDSCRESINGCGDWHEVAKNFTSLLSQGEYAPSYQGPGLFHLEGNLYFLMANHQYGCQGTDADDLTRATLNARREIQKQLSILRSRGAKWENIQLATTASCIGTRESRRLHGLYEVTLDDIITGRRHPDGICPVTAGIDIHALGGTGHCKIEKTDAKVKGYDIPLRALINADVSNLLMAGRCISGDFFAHASYRVSGNAATMGEATGVLAAIAVRNGISPESVAYRDVQTALGLQPVNE